jgi:uncharacterized protein (DUF4415 family)
MSKVPKKWKLSPKARVVPKDQRHEFPPEAFESRNTKVRITMYVDLDVLEYFKTRAAKDGGAYQTQMNQELRAVMERNADQASPAVQLREAKGLIDAALRSIR